MPGRICSVWFIRGKSSCTARKPVTSLNSRVAPPGHRCFIPHRTGLPGASSLSRAGHSISAAWEYVVPHASETSASVTCWIDFTPGTEQYEKFGFDHRLSLTYELDQKGLKISYKVENRDSRQLPYGIAVHPYFNFLGARESAILCVPAQWHMEAVNLMPTGKLEKLDGAAFDIRQPTPVPNLVLDDVYFGMRPENPAWIEYRQEGIRLQLAASEEFTHMVVYIQPQNAFFCVENQTCSTDAHNLYAQGLEEESNLQIVPAGGVREGWVHYILEQFK